MTNGNYYLIVTIISRKSIKPIEHTFVESTLWNPDKENNLALSMKLVMEPENPGRIPLCENEILGHCTNIFFFWL